MRSPIEDKKRFIQITFLWLNILLLALIIRLPFLPHISFDYNNFVEPWFKFFISEGYSVFKYDIFYYNVPYPYLVSLAATFLPDFPVIAIKSISIIFDFILAFFVYKCVNLKYRYSETIPTLAALAVLFSPTVILNSAAWGQNDTIYTALLVACLYALLTGRQGWASFAFGLSISFKAQALFLAPFFLWMLLKNQVKWRYLPLIPLVYITLIIPARFIGRPLNELLLIYVNQVNRYPELTQRAPNLYQWIHFSRAELYTAGIILSVYIMLPLTLLVYKSRVEVTANLQIHLAIFSVLIMPFILPGMHERYFISAEIVAIIFAFYLPRNWYIPVVISLTSFMTYTRSLYGYEIIPLDWLSIFMLVPLVVLGVKLLRTLEHLAPPRSNVPDHRVPVHRRIE